MFSKQLKSPVKGLLMTVLVASLGGLSVAYAAGSGTDAAGVSKPPPVTTSPVTLPPAATLPSTPTPAPATGVPGNPDGSCPASAPVKVSKSKIYHVPEELNYKNTKAKLCFEDAQAAQKAGYRAPKK